jgi:hypothetical protein
LPATELPLRDHLEPGALEVKGLHASFRRRALIEKSLEDAPADPDSALRFVFWHEGDIQETDFQLITYLEMSAMPFVPLFDHYLRLIAENGHPMTRRT